MWGDGLPIILAMEGRVHWITTGTDLRRDALVGEGKTLILACSIIAGTDWLRLW